MQYRIHTTAGEVLDIDNPSKMPTPDRIEQMEEPYVRSSVYVPTEFMTAIYKLAQDKRGVHKSLEYLGKRVHIRFDFPLAEIVVDFYDRLKSISRGYASFDYEFADFRPSELVKLDILLNGDPVDALSVIVHRDKAYERGKMLVEKLRAVIPRQMFEVAIQAAIGSRVIARETRQGHGQERHRQVLRRRHHAQAQAARASEGRQEAHEAGRARSRYRRRRSCRSSRADGPRAQAPDSGRRDGVRVRRLPRSMGPSPGEETPAATDGQVAAPLPAARRRKSVLREYVEAIAIAILLALVIRTLIVQAFTIPSGSMMDTLLVGDYILVNKFLYGPEVPLTDYRLPALRLPHRGDIIVFKYPQDEKRDFIKRIVGTPGDTVQVRGQQVFINGQPIDEPYVRRNPNPLGHTGTASFCGYAYACDPLVVPADSYFVMGDNRDNSQDSRYWGFVKRDKIKGKAFSSTGRGTATGTGSGGGDSGTTSPDRRGGDGNSARRARRDGSPPPVPRTVHPRPVLHEALPLLFVQHGAAQAAAGDAAVSRGRAARDRACWPPRRGRPASRSRPSFSEAARRR